MEKANNFHSSIKSTAEMGSETEITFSETKVYEGVRFNKEPVLDGQTDYKPTRCLAKQKPFTYSCQPPGVKKYFIKGEALRRLRTDSSQTTLEENIKKNSKIAW